MHAIAINENKWISIVKYGCQCNKWNYVDKSYHAWIPVQ